MRVWKTLTKQSLVNLTII